MKKTLLILKISCLILGLSAAFFYGYIQNLINREIPIDEPKIIQIAKGESLRKIADNLQENGLVEKAYFFEIYSKINKIYPQIKAGEYLIAESVSLKKLANILTSGKVYLRKITFAEGLTIREIAEILYNNNLLDVDFSIPPEGYFLPETYTFSRGEMRQNIVEQGQKALQDFLQSAWDNREQNLPLKNKEELLILASIVEKETGVAAERPQVASVFINRLRKGMLLQTDPTVIYALTKGQKELERPLTRKDLTIDSLYNTYKYAGLPPGPICNPGKASILAASHPDKTPYLYFVASGNGGHNFARTLSEHNENVRKWRILSK